MPFYGAHLIHHSPVYGNPDERHKITLRPRMERGNKTLQISGKLRSRSVAFGLYSDIRVCRGAHMGADLVGCNLSMGTRDTVYPRIKMPRWGHLYLYNAVLPTVLLWAYIYDSEVGP